MNNKIEELAEESGMTQYVAANNKFLERFAKMVAEECTTKCSKTKSLGKDGWPEHYSAYEIRAMIEREFGLTT